MKINDIIKHKNAFYYYIITANDKNNVILKRVYYCSKKSRWIIDKNNLNEFGTINNILPKSSLKYFTKID